MPPEPVRLLFADSKERFKEGPLVMNQRVFSFMRHKPAGALIRFSVKMAGGADRFDSCVAY